MLTPSPASRRAVAATAVVVAVLVPGAPLAGASTRTEQAKADIRAEWPQASESRAISVADCESGLNPSAVGGKPGGTRYYGLFQLSAATLKSVGYSTTQAMDGRTNARAAYTLYRRSGWRSWHCQ